MEITKEEALEGNKLLADFMDVEFIITKDGRLEMGIFDDEEDDEIQYHSSMDWMWPVIDQINSMGKEYSFATFKTYISCTVEKSSRINKDFHFANAEYITTTQTSNEAIYRLLVKFAKWYKESIIKKNLVDSK